MICSSENLLLRIVRLLVGSTDTGCDAGHRRGRVTINAENPTTLQVHSFARHEMFCGGNMGEIVSPI